MAKKPEFGHVPWRADEEGGRRGASSCVLPHPNEFLTGQVWQPAADIHETPDAVVLKMDVAGLDPRNAEVLLQGGEIIVRGRRCDTTAPDRVAIHHMEITYGCFARRFTVNVPFDPDGVEASYENGFLLVRLPKVEQPVRKRVRLTIQ